MCDDQIDLRFYLLSNFDDNIRIQVNIKDINQKKSITFFVNASTIQAIS